MTAPLTDTAEMREYILKEVRESRECIILHDEQSLPGEEYACMDDPLGFTERITWGMSLLAAWDEVGALRERLTRAERILLFYASCSGHSNARTYMIDHQMPDLPPVEERLLHLMVENDGLIDRNDKLRARVEKGEKLCAEFPNLFAQGKLWGTLNTLDKHTKGDGRETSEWRDNLRQRIMEIESEWHVALTKIAHLAAVDKGE